MAGPSTIAVPIRATSREEVALLPCPSESSLVNELRQMVLGILSLNDSRKAYGLLMSVLSADELSV